MNDVPMNDPRAFHILPRRARAKRRPFPVVTEEDDLSDDPPDYLPDNDEPDELETEGAQLLDDIYAFLGRYVIYPFEAAHVAHTLWIVHTHLMDAWESTPRIAFLSPESESGKTRALEVTELLVPEPVIAINVTPAYLFRKIGDGAGEIWRTILYDEVDTVFGPKAKNNEEIRGLLNAGHRRGAVAGRCVVKGKRVETEEIPAYSAVALAGIGDLPDTILSRSVNIPMRRRAADERIEPFRRRTAGKEGKALRERIEAWAARILPGVRGLEPDLPKEVVDRQADIWEPLFCVASAAGPAWLERVEVSAVSLVSLSRGKAQSLGVLLLGHLRDLFGDEEWMRTSDILAKLHGMEEAPWSDLRGQPLTARGLANFLKRYEIKSRQQKGSIWVEKDGQRVLEAWAGKAYVRADLTDAWSRYLPVSPTGSETAETAETSEARP